MITKIARHGHIGHLMRLKQINMKHIIEIDFIELDNDCLVEMDNYGLKFDRLFTNSNGHMTGIITADTEEELWTWFVECYFCANHHEIDLDDALDEFNAHYLKIDQ